MIERLPLNTLGVERIKDSEMIEKIVRIVVLCVCAILLVALGGGWLGEKIFLNLPTAAFGLLLFLMGGLVVDFYYYALRSPEVPDMGSLKYLEPPTKTQRWAIEDLNPPTIQPED